MSLTACAASLLLFLAAPVLHADLPAERFHGQVLVQNNGPQRIVVLVDSFEGTRGPDGVVDHVFVLAGSGDFGSATSVLYEAADVEVHPHAVAIHSPRDRSAIILATHELDLRFADGTTTTRFTGDALSHHSGRTNLRIPSLRRSAGDAYATSCDNCYPYELDPYGDSGSTGATTCSAGGVGASSCSIGCGTATGSSCSVSCTTGYACCSCSFGQASCKCQR
ncbi:MAG TPA: hypothetical protein VF698_19285 [Thermoanaerobaculia bacterium]|jgi:hypothetical protein